ncbi:MAG TPA: winged helix-turn-helix domain-containing protein [Acidimicrobiales bacterium]|nr:winged helix-turn-helix domain-containing protein [Acidimicrobiales bacterium]
MVDDLAGVRPEIALVRWPEQESTRAALRESGHPRVLLLHPSTPAPEPGDALEDWVRIPVAEADLRARVRWLAHRVASAGPGRAGAGAEGGEPVLDDDGLVRVGDRWVALPPVEHRLAQALLARMGTVVTREALARAGWPEGAPGRNALDVHVLRLRRRLAPLDLTIHTVRSRGYLLEAGAPAQGRASS